MQHLELSADLVVLSGCDTGRSAKGKSDELIGWTNAVLQAGAHSALVSLWPVDDLSTSAFMNRFYTLMGNHAPHDVSLQQAMIAHRQEYPHPFYWAPFVLVGNPEP
jgi:CHAT domain-containing protein